MGQQCSKCLTATKKDQIVTENKKKHQLSQGIKEQEKTRKNTQHFQKSIQDKTSIKDQKNQKVQNKNSKSESVENSNSPPQDNFVIIFIQSSSNDQKTKILRQALTKLEDKDLQVLFYTVLKGVLQLADFFKGLGDPIIEIILKLAIIGKGFEENLKQQRQKLIEGFKILLNNPRELSKFSNEQFEQLIKVANVLLQKKHEGDNQLIKLMFQQYTKLWILCKLSEGVIDRNSDQYLLLTALSTNAQLLFRKFGLKIQVRNRNSS